MSRIQTRFADLASKNETAFVAYVMAGDKHYDSSLSLIKALPSAGVDVLEIGIPFTDPMADGPTIQLAAQRALDMGMTLEKTLNVVREFRKDNEETPIVLMGYYNPIYSMGVEKFLESAVEAGVDGLIVVDLPPEEDSELCLPALAKGVDFIRLATPTTDDARLPKVLENTSGFLYYVSVTGITGAQAANAVEIAPEIARIKSHTDIPVCVGFGISKPEHAKAVGAVADGVVVGSAIVKQIEADKSQDEILAFVSSLSQAAKSTN